MIATLAATAAQTIPTTWAIDPADSRVEFAVKNLLVRTVKGRFQAFDGTIEFDEAEPAGAMATVAIAADSVDTGQPKRDAHLRSDDFLGAERFPRLTFRSTRVEVVAPRQARLYGALTIRDVTRDVALDTIYEGRDIGPAGRPRARFRATTAINRSEFGVRWNPLGGFVAGDRVEITLDITAVPLG